MTKTTWRTSLYNSNRAAAPTAIHVLRRQKYITPPGLRTGRSSCGPPPNEVAGVLVCWSTDVPKNAVGALPLSATANAPRMPASVRQGQISPTNNRPAVPNFKGSPVAELRTRRLGHCAAKAAPLPRRNRQNRHDDQKRHLGRQMKKRHQQAECRRKIQSSARLRANQCPAGPKASPEF